MVQRLIICFSDSEIRTTIKLSLQKKDSLIIALNSNVSEFQKNNLKFKTVQDYDIDKLLASLPKLVYEHYIKWGEMEVNGQKLKDLLNISGFNFWKNVQATFCDKLYAHKTPGLKFVLIFKEIFSAEQPIEVCASLQNHTGLAAKAVASQLKIKFIKSAQQSKNILQPIITRLSHAFVLTRTKKIRYPALNQTGKKKLMFVLSMPTALQVLYPIIETVKQKFDVLCVLVEISSNKNLEAQTKAKNLPYALLQSYYSKYIAARVKDTFRNYENFGLPKNINFEFCGANVTEIVKTVFEFYFRPRQYVEEVILVNELFKNAITIEQPDVIITVDESSDLSKPMLDYAKSLGIKTMAVQHAFLDQYPAFNNTIAPDTIFTWGKTSAAEYELRGFPGKNIIICGAPKFDTLINQTHNLNEISIKYNLDLNKKTIMFASQPISTSETQAILAALINYVNKNNLQLVIKLHPREETLFYEKFTHTVKTKCVITKEDLYPLIALSELVVINSSLVGLEAAVMHKPVVVANFSGLPDRVNYVSDRIALGAKSEKELHDVISLLLNSPEEEKLIAARKSFFNKHLAGMDGRATEKVVTVIEELFGIKKT